MCSILHFSLLKLRAKDITRRQSSSDIPAMSTHIDESIIFVIVNERHSQFGFGWGCRCSENSSHFVQCFVEVGLHVVVLEVLRHNIELEGVIGNHVCDTVPVRNNFSPPVSIIELTRDL